MLCESCRERPATVHMTRVVNGEKTERHLCERCAREEGEFVFELEPKFSINQLLSGLLEGLPTPGARRGITRAVTRCEACGMSYEDFARTGKFGCDRCYKTFDRELESLFRRLHGHARHTGKTPRGTGVVQSLRRQIQELRDELNRAVAEERYERAAELRDEIKHLEAKLTGDREG